MDTWKSNWIWVLITFAVILIPIVRFLLINKLEDFNFSPSHIISIFLSSAGAVVSAIRVSYKKLSPIVASLWKIKEDYIQEKEAAIFKFQQEEKALQLEVKNFQLQINSINNRIEQAEEITKNLDFRINKTLSTETLFEFIEKKADSDDYKKYLGIVSTIRKDFEILSNLFKGSVEEQSDNESTNFIKQNYPNLLDRIVLYIDDLDRCEEKRVVEVLEAVNLLMAFPLFIVVVGVDPRWVKIALEAKYQKQFTLKTEEEGLRVSPSNYLEKIFQIPFRLKSAEDQDSEIHAKIASREKNRIACRR